MIFTIAMYLNFFSILSKIQVFTQLFILQKSLYSKVEYVYVADAVCVLCKI